MIESSSIQNSIDNHDDNSFVISIFLNGRADVRRVIKPVHCNRITNYHAKLKTKATTQNGAPISKCKEKKWPFATSIRRCNRTRRMKGENEDFALRLYIAKICIAAKQKYGRNCTMLFYVSYDGWWCAHCTRTFRDMTTIYTYKLYGYILQVAHYQSRGA